MIAGRREMLRRARRVALRSAREQGCVCGPDVQVRWVAPGVTEAIAEHHPWCPLIRARDEGRVSMWKVHLHREDES
jgi:hypothetical protein